MIAPASLRGRSQRELAAVMASGHRFDPDAAAGWIYRGTSLGLPALVERLAWVKFAKAFHREPSGVRGWNLRIEQDALDRPWRPKLRAGRPVTFGAFDVVDDHAGIVLDYRGERGPLRALRDPLVALDDRADVLFGRSLVAIAGRTFATPSYFLLERDVPVAEVRPR
ncbi:MAG TPA: hypothetical protein VMJ10_04555 [Kofleriaceae bacterium]|nr:hypothetical protein [Kofleriaceae bacterium]